MIPEKAWYRLSPAEVFEALDSNAEFGLSSDEAKRRLLEYGPNELQRAHRVSGWEVFAAQFKNLLIVILLVAGVLSAILGQAIEAVARQRAQPLRKLSVRTVIRLLEVFALY